MTARERRRIEAEERELFEQIYKPLRRFAAVIVPAGADPDDLVQEALVRALRNHRLDEIEHPVAYLKRTMMNLTANEVRRRRVQRLATDRWAASAAHQAPEGFPSDLAELMRLTPRARAVLYLAEVERYSYDEISQMLGCTSAAARKRASKARRHLRAVLTAGGW